MEIAFVNNTTSNYKRVAQLFLCLRTRKTIEIAVIYCITLAQKRHRKVQINVSSLQSSR